MSDVDRERDNSLGRSPDSLRHQRPQYLVSSGSDEHIEHTTASR